MKKIEIGQKLIAFWGAMHPIEELVVEELLYGDNGQVELVRAKDPEDQEVAHLFEVKNIRPDYNRAFHGVGIYYV